MKIEGQRLAEDDHDEEKREPGESPEVPLCDVAIDRHLHEIGLREAEELLQRQKGERKPKETPIRGKIVPQSLDQSEIVRFAENLFVILFHDVKF